MVKILLTKNAKNDIKIIYNYYKTYTSINVSNKIIKGLINSFEILKSFPDIGKIDKFELVEYKFIIYEHYKIVYKFKNEIIYILKIFDTRQKPSNLKIKNDF